MLFPKNVPTGSVSAAWLHQQLPCGNGWKPLNQNHLETRRTATTSAVADIFGGRRMLYKRQFLGGIDVMEEASAI
jgi:hypothetical protein